MHSVALSWRNQGTNEVVLSTLLTALMVAELVGQYYRKIPTSYPEGIVNSDSLIFPDLFIQLSSGHASVGDWIANPAPYWLTDFMTTWVFMSLTGNDWLFSLALYSVLMCLLVTWGLATVVRLASGSTWTRSWLVSAVLVATSVVLIRIDDSLPGSFLVGNRPFNVAAFFFVCAGLAKVVASGRAAHPLSWVYCVSCLAFGASDAMLMFHVALPVLLASLYWLRIAGFTRETCGFVAVSATGVVMVLAGFLLNDSLSPFASNVSVNSVNVSSHPLWKALARVASAFDHSIFDGLTTVGFLIVEWPARMSVTTHSSIPLNSMLFLSTLPLTAWAFTAQVRKNAKRKPRDLQACAKVLLIAMAWSLILCASSVFVFLTEWRHLWSVMWVPFLSLAVVNACRKGNAMAWKRIERLAVLAIVVVLAIDLSFFRPTDVVSVRLVCSRSVLDGTGLERGMSHYWHAREVKVTGGFDNLDLVFNSSLVRGRPTEFNKYLHVGNVGHAIGKADYVVVADEEGDELSAFREGYGLPSRIATCAEEIYLLYERESLSADEPGSIVVQAAKNV